MLISENSSSWHTVCIFNGIVEILQYLNEMGLDVNSASLSRIGLCIEECKIKSRLQKRDGGM